MDEVRNAFHKVKEDFFSLKKEVDFLKTELYQMKGALTEIFNSLDTLNKEFFNYKERNQTQNKAFPSYNSLQQTDRHIFKPRYGQNLGISTGNRGVKTDRQTDQQTNKQVEKGVFSKEKPFLENLDNASELLGSLDNLKKEVRIKFKRLTEQELLVFSTIYLLEEEKGYSDYRSLSQKLNLSESSIRDYVRRLILKGIPLEKTKVNNKEVRIFISKSLKKIASLETILQLIGI